MEQPLYDQQVFFQNYLQLRANPVNYNRLLEQPALRALLPPVSGKEVLDLGCGFGDSCAAYLRLGAQRVTGVDVSRNMLREAQKRNGAARISYRQMDLETISFPAETFNLVTSSLAFHYIRNFSALVLSIFTCLKPGGSLVFSQEHPLTTAPWKGPAWVQRGEQIYYQLNGYGSPGPRTVEWLEQSVHKYHRTFSQICNALLQAGFQIAGMQEPIPEQAALEQNPGMQKEFEKPSFLLIRADKPDAKK